MGPRGKVPDGDKANDPDAEARGQADGEPSRPTPGQRIRARRRELGLTQVDLAAAVGVSRQTVISMETGDYAPSVYLALKVASTLHGTVEDLWGE
jgi:putative transcriptional regulator